MRTLWCRVLDPIIGDMLRVENIIGTLVVVVVLGTLSNLRMNIVFRFVKLLIIRPPRMTRSCIHIGGRLLLWRSPLDDLVVPRTARMARTV